MKLGVTAWSTFSTLLYWAHAFNNPPGVDIWCGKAYRADNASFAPGGWLEEPVKSTTPLLDFKISPRMNIYLETYLIRKEVFSLTPPSRTFSSGFFGNAKLSLKIFTNGSAITSVNQTSVNVNTVNNEIHLSLEPFPAALHPYNVTVFGTLSQSNATVFTASTQLYKLPSRVDGGSVTRLDNLYGGLSVRKGAETEWSLIFPFTYYVQWTLYWNSSLSTLDEFAAMGYNVIHIVPTGELGDTPFPWNKFEPYLERADKLGLYLQYDVRWEWANLSADIILTDVYPIGNNNTYSTVYNTPCNTTYGCCGCDDCVGVFEDISDRLDNFAHFDELLGWSKTHWAAPQAFGNETFWTRFPTAAEEVVMNMLSINHGAKGVNMWDFPTSSDILAVTNRLATVLTSQRVASFLLGAPLIQKLNVEGATRVDVAAWLGSSSMLLSVVNLNYGNLAGPISVTLPEGAVAISITSSLWGNIQWSIKGNKVETDNLLGLGVSLIIVALE
ncbi:hypothetical protein FKW77_010634 [Venturia effusa]|uniref:Uncharacterized protein n=1 Tax=Venturia effusa TaxID=50376 RepID=A0A517KY23_9PEZI|nr:hypothetical protein FKW77_010634 [Venturia effusa]